MTRSDALRGKVAVVLGAAGQDNMGQVIARHMVEAGAQVVVAGRHGDELQRDIDASVARAAQSQG